LKIAYIAAGAGGMYCGSCIHDNTLAAALQRLGHEVALLPTYTPLRTDEANVSSNRVFYGAVNVYLQEKIPLFRRTPAFLDRLLDRPALLRWVMRFSASTDARELGELTLDVLRGEQGPQRKELDKLVEWLGQSFRPDIVQITNSMLLGLVRRMKRELGVPVVVAVQGEDLFIEDLPDPYRERVVAEMRARAAEADGFIAPSRYYAEHMAKLLDVPAEKISVVPLGISIEGHDRPLPETGKETGGLRLEGHGHTDAGTAKEGGRLRLGYLARISPEKGLHLLVEAFRELANRPNFEGLELEVAGYLGPKDREYFEDLEGKIAEWGLENRFHYAGELDRAQKISFFRSLDLFSVPTAYREPKGLFVLESLANAVPVVQPRHGSFPEILDATGGGILVEPGSAKSLAEGLASLLQDPEARRQLGARGREAVLTRFSDEEMARQTLAFYERFV
jgi:glycosyltransferase involved in cell wall biosynthesis